MGVGPPASASWGDFLAPRRRSSPARGVTRVPKAALGPLAMAILALLVWSSRGGSRGAPSRASTARQETLSSAGVVRPSHETTRASANAGVVVKDGRRTFEPFERVRVGDRSNAEALDEYAETDARVERVRQIIDDSHLPSLPPLPPDAPLPPRPEAPPSGRDGTEALSAGRDGTDTQKALPATKRVAGGDFVWSRPLRASR